MEVENTTSWKRPEGAAITAQHMLGAIMKIFGTWFWEKLDFEILDFGILCFGIFILYIIYMFPGFGFSFSGWPKA